MRYFFSDLPPRILSQYDEKKGKFVAWYFDGYYPVSEEVEGNTRQEAIANLEKTKLK